MPKTIAKDEVVLPEQFIESAQTYLEEMMAFKRQKVVVLQDSVIPSVIMLKYEEYKRLLHQEKEAKKEIKSTIGTKEKGMLFAVRNKIHFFQDLSDDEILQVTQGAVFQTLTHGTTVFEQGEMGREIYFVVKGSVDIQGKNRHQHDKYEHLATIVEGNVFGEIGPVIEEARTARAVISSNNTLLLAITLTDEVTSENATAYNRLYSNIIRALSRKLIQSNESLYKLNA